jgi:hypothetical protein
MSENFVVVATVSIPGEAEIARGRLQAEGIRAHLTGVHSSTVFSGIMQGQVSLYVPEEDFERATELLADCMGEPLSELPGGESPRREKLEDYWVCSLCGDTVDVSETVCPDCGTSRDALTSGQSDALALERLPRRANPPSEQITDEKGTPDLGLETGVTIPEVAELHEGDALASRALRAVLFTMLVPIFFPLALWYLVKLMSYDGELTPRGMRRLYIALFLNLFTSLYGIFAMLLLLGGIFGAFRH